MTSHQTNRCHFATAVRTARPACQPKMRRELAWISGPLLRRLRQLSTSSIYLSTNCSLRGAAQCHNASVEGVQPGLESPTVDGKVFTRNKDLPDRWTQQTWKRSVNVGKRAATTGGQCLSQLQRRVFDGAVLRNCANHGWHGNSGC